MRKIAQVLVLLISSLSIIGCAVQASTPAIKNQKIVITYFSIVDSPPNV
jgi:hypothetical protein